MKRLFDIHSDLIAAGPAGAVSTRRMASSAATANQICSLVERFVR